MPILETKKQRGGDHAHHSIFTIILTLIPPSTPKRQIKNSRTELIRGGQYSPSSSEIFIVSGQQSRSSQRASSFITDNPYSPSSFSIILRTNNRGKKIKQHLKQNIPSSPFSQALIRQPIPYKIKFKPRKIYNKKTKIEREMKQ